MTTTAPKETKVKTKTPKVKAEPKRGVGTVAIEAIKSGASNEEALAAVQKEFPDRKTTMASINWYRNNLRQNGTKGVKSARELKAAAKKEADKAAKAAAPATPAKNGKTNAKGDFLS